MNEKVASIIQKAQQERKRSQFPRALKRLEQGIASHPDELDLYLEAVDTAIDGGELLQATNLLKTTQDKFVRERERVQQFVSDKLQTVHDPSLARCVVEHAVKRRDLEGALALLENVPDHIVRDLQNRTRTKAQSLKSASHGGYTLRGETVSNEITNAVLSVRLGNLKEAVITIVNVLAEKPVEHKVLDGFLASLAAKNGKSGRINYARGCALRAGGNEVEAVHELVEGARLEPACAANCAEQLQAMLENAKHPGKVRRALGEALLIKGDTDGAASVLREYLAENTENAREVIMLLRPFIDNAAELNACTWLAVELALGLEQSSVAMELLRGLQQHGHASDVYAWLEAHAGAAGAPDVAMFHASLALDQKQYERAVEILERVCSGSKEQVTPVLSLIEKHRSAHVSVEALYRTYAPADTPQETVPESNDGDFQMFEANEFRLERAASSAPQSTQAQKRQSPPRFATSPFSTSDNGPDLSESGGAQGAKPLIENTELQFGDDGTIQRKRQGEPVKSAPSPSIEITESHVENVAQKLYETGASAFFHIDDGAAEGGDEPASGTEPAPFAAPEAGSHAPEAETAASRAQAAHLDTGIASSNAAAGANAGDSAVAPKPETPAPFAERFARFTRGELANPDILALLEEAVHDEHVDELHELLYFQPQTSAEHFARYYYQAEYHVLCNRPLQALEILARLDTPGLSDEEKERLWYKIAIAQRLTHNFAGAESTLDRLLQLFPGREEFARLKRRNHQQFIESQSLAATTLEKTSSLD
ncbi:MAG TPA: hypothetical protein VFH88_08720 [Candidatus Krumholzibacteria bacterium]|nr:hypothetical protein [Candidatus Krumholzibacteria bacterium]